MKTEEEKFFTGPFRPSNILMVSIFAWAIYVMIYPQKYINTGHVYLVILLGGGVLYSLVLLTTHKHLIAASFTLLVTILMPTFNDNILVTSSSTACQVIGKYYWVSPNNKNRNSSLRLTYQLQCPDGIKKAGGPIFGDYPYDVGDKVFIKNGFLNFKHI